MNCDVWRSHSRIFACGSSLCVRICKLKPKNLKYLYKPKNLFNEKTRFLPALITTDS